MLVRHVFFVLLLALSLTAIVYGGFFRDFRVYDNLEKFHQLQQSGITIKIPGFRQNAQGMEPESQSFTEPEVVSVMTFAGIGRYKDGRLMSKYPDLRALKKGRMPCPS
jgi:hypothetical protein